MGIFFKKEVLKIAFISIVSINLAYLKLYIYNAFDKKKMTSI